jgi:hypothetical protein
MLDQSITSPFVEEIWKMSRLEQWLQLACSQLGLNIDLNFVAAMPDGRVISTIARIQDLGAPNGMLVFRSYSVIAGISNLILSAGYGYTVLDEPTPSEVFDIDEYKEMFLDWGWSGDISGKPNWT